MFKKPRANKIESNEGFSVEVLGRTGLLYCEGIRKLHIDSEILAGTAGIALYAYSIKNWDPPDNSEIIDDNKKKSIVENICKAFNFYGEKIDLVN